MSFYKIDSRNKTPFTKFLSNGIEIVMEFSDLYDDFRPSKLIINKFNNQKFPDTSIIFNEIQNKLGYSIVYSEDIESKINTWETKIISSLKSKK